mmetsp:Transcript_4219/g.10949  ORF Transcript_4219/g.10949 Transcript_4219/m.10949 type:complete len:127 (+) Transcript_4219:335-715(+)
MARRRKSISVFNMISYRIQLHCINSNTLNLILHNAIYGTTLIVHHSPYGTTGKDDDYFTPRNSSKLPLPQVGPKLHYQLTVSPPKKASSLSKSPWVVLRVRYSCSLCHLIQRPFSSYRQQVFLDQR